MKVSFWDLRWKVASTSPKFKKFKDIDDIVDAFSDCTAIFTKSCNSALNFSRPWKSERSKMLRTSLLGNNAALPWQIRCKFWLKATMSKDGTSKNASKSSKISLESGEEQPLLGEGAKGAKGVMVSSLWISRTPIRKHRSLDRFRNCACKSSTFMWFWSESTMCAFIAITGASCKRELAKCLETLSRSSPKKSRNELPARPAALSCVCSSKLLNFNESSVKIKASSTCTTAS